MRYLTPLAVFVLAIITSQGRSIAADANETEAQTVSATVSQAQCVNGCVNGYDAYRQQPDPGPACSPAHGHNHFTAPLHAFTSWYRPRASTLGRDQRCAPDEFRPRGYGHLFARQCDPYRMEYTPYAIGEACSQYGPAYMIRIRDQRCEDCDHCAHR